LVFRAFDPELEFPKHEHFTRLQAKAGNMAPTRSEDPMMQLMVKIEEGNREMQKRMDLLQTTMTGMEVTMKGVVSEQIGIQKWKPEMEMKVKDLTETLKDVQMKVDQVALNLPSISSAGGVQIEKKCQHPLIWKLRC
jgi:archaellum component FlaC